MNEILEDIRDAVYAKDFDEAWQLAEPLSGGDKTVAESFIRKHQRETVDISVTLWGVKLRILEKNYTSNGAPGLVVEVAETVKIRRDEEYEAPETYYAGECWGILTANLSEKPGPGEFFIKTWEEASKDLLRLLLKEGHFEKTGKTIQVSPWAEVDVWRAT